MRDGAAQRPRSNGAQVAAEAMPYHSDRRHRCKTVAIGPGTAGRDAHRALAARSSTRRRGPPLSDLDRAGRPPPHAARYTVGVEYLVRAARITDIDRLVTLGDLRARCPRLRASARSPPTCSANSSTFPRPASSSPRRGARWSVARCSRCARRSGAGGYVGTVDLLVVDPAMTRIASVRRCSRRSSGRRATRAAPSSRRRSPRDADRAGALGAPGISARGAAPAAFRSWPGGAAARRS